jgi:hypothetical protein
MSVMLVFSTPLVNCCPSTFSFDLPHLSPFPTVNKRQIQTVFGCGGVGVELCCRPYSAALSDSKSTQLLHHLKQKHQWRRHLEIGVFMIPSSMVPLFWYQTGSGINIFVHSCTGVTRYWTVQYSGISKTFLIWKGIHTYILNVHTACDGLGYTLPVHIASGGKRYSWNQPFNLLPLSHQAIQI